MNETFSINRFYKLLKKELTEKTPKILKISAIFSLLLFGYWLSIILFKGQPVSIGARSAYVLFATFVTMIIAPFNLYKSYNHPKRGVDYITLPASITEKFLSMQTITVFILPLITFSLILLADTILSTITPSIFSGYTVSGLWVYEKPFENILEALIFQQGCILGNFMFQKNKIFKTMLSGAGLYIVIAMIFVFLVSVVFKSQFDAMQHMNLQINISNISDLSKLGNNGEVVGQMQVLTKFVFAIFYVIFPVGFLAGTFYKMKTQQY